MQAAIFMNASCMKARRSNRIADLGIAELPFDHPERMLDLGPDAGLDSLNLIDERVTRLAFVQLSSPANSRDSGTSWSAISRTCRVSRLDEQLN